MSVQTQHRGASQYKEDDVDILRVSIRLYTPQCRMSSFISQLHIQQDGFCSVITRQLCPLDNLVTGANQSALSCFYLKLKIDVRFVIRACWLVLFLLHIL